MDKEFFVDYIMYTSCERCPIQTYCSFKSPQYFSCEDVARKYYDERMVSNAENKESNPKIRMV